MILPEVVRNKAVAAGAAWWIDALADIVAGLEQEWSITIGRPFDEGTEAFVAEAEMADGTPAVLKVLVPRAADVAEREAIVLRLADGDGCPLLHRADPSRGALLMERLGPSMHSLGLSYEHRLPALCDAAARIWRPAPACGLPTGAAKADWLMEFITTTWDALDRPCPERAVEHALVCAHRRRAAHDDERAVLVHGDVHQWNALRAGDGFKLVDPDGLLAEAEYDLGVILREDPDEPLAADPMSTAHWMATRCGVDATAIFEWAVVERVSTGLLATQIELQPVGRQMLELADRLALAR
ncbi:MAG TPA: aminoglycoside phosphotransferase family protein [Ilumatobacteraceae bacterium]|nr:aminoglycoside phosphotransferase family protein [Ilumatobacteraceae bacterium]